MTLGQRIRQRRRVMSLTQQQLAQALNVTPQHVSAVEQDKRTPSLSTIDKWAEELGVSIDYLVTGKEGVITNIIPAIKADKTLNIEIKRALITLLQAIYNEGIKK